MVRQNKHFCGLTFSSLTFKAITIIFIYFIIKKDKICLNIMKIHVPGKHQSLLVDMVNYMNCAFVYESAHL